MRDNDIPVKTAAGQQEIGLKQRKLTPRARSLLIMIHGAETVTELTRSMRSLGDVGAILDELAALGLVTAFGGGGGLVRARIEVPAADAAPPVQQVKQLLNETVVASLGVLGGLTAFRFTLKLEHCYSADELRGLFPEFQRIVGKAKSVEFAEKILGRAQSLLAQG
ncbi:MAG: hypothetical protein P4L92_12675 [Rudaea sp.]|nr:hypothetical protein [Rudaea sp.]